MSSAEWIQALPKLLQSQISSVVAKNPEAEAVFTALYHHLQPNNDNGPVSKRKKTGANAVSSSEPVKNAVKDVATVTTNTNKSIPNNGDALNIDEKTALITLNDPIVEETVIFEISQVSFLSPVRKKLNLTFHLIERNNQPIPVLSIVNPNTQTPDVSLINLSRAIKLCALVPIVGNSTNPQKKIIVLLCFWINEAFIDDPASPKDPIICQINLDLIKKQMIKLGKLPANIESQFEKDSNSNLNMNPIQERIIDYFQRQFKLCGINLVNYLPCSSLFNNKYTLNSDNAVAMATNNSKINNLLMVECHRGAKDGVLLFLTENEFNVPYIIFGFKKPVMLFEVSKVKHTSYSNIARLTFSLLLTVITEEDEEKTVEFSMIDQAHFQLIDDYIKSQNINDNSFDDNLREKGNDKESKNAEAETESNLQAVTEEMDEDDEDDDASYHGGGDDEDGDGGSDIGSGSDDDAEFDSDVGSNSGDDNLGSDNDEDGVEGEQEEEEEEEETEEVDDGVFNKAKEEEESE
ncbi:regulator of Ty1 transposition [Scheffersomyces xylosifermentans]|uniref:regulator of Ty1 transposition n=1 Tax=Scheffersomyces xylosifermentans TaxID=1304137 RepID=UPI00315DBE3C